MTGRRLTLALVAALAVGGCATTPEAPPATPSGAAGAGATLTTGATLGPLPSPVTSPGSGPTRCPKPGAAVLPDGTWDGPLSLRVTGVAGVPVGRSTGTGQLRLVVQGGQLVQGVWTITWRSSGTGTTDHGEAIVRLSAEIAGTVHGPATRPSVHGAWTVAGTVKVTSPVAATVPVARSGQGDAQMTVRATTCDAVSGSFVLPTGRNRLTRLSGVARWVGHRVA